MKAPLGWLREFVSVEVEPKRLAEALTHAGIECSVELEGTLEGVVVAEVVEVADHPDSRHLKVCRVRGRGEEHYSVVCGAPNVREGIKAPLILPGATLPGGRGIDCVEIRGVRSEGMLCSEAELEVGEDASGIWILPDHLSTGERVDQQLGLCDWVLELDVTPNRGDCLSVMGVAREIAAIYRLPLRPPRVELEEKGVPISERFSVRIDDPELCPRYVAKLVEGVAIQESPLWMRRRLQLCGLRPINNIVDVTNYVMLELGQPLHAFDLHLLEGSMIVVKRARSGERFVSLDGQERVLTNEMLMIWDGEKPVAVAGVMGGENSEVIAHTRDVLIESACFDPISIRRTAKALGMATEASRRFERSTDPNGCLFAAERAAQLMSQLAGGTVAPGAVDVYPRPPKPVSIRLRVDRVNALLGTRLETHQVRDIMERLGLPCEGHTEGVLTVTPHTRRPDLCREVDLVEEVARIWGYHKIPSDLPKLASAPIVMTPGREVERTTRQILMGWGFNEVITYSFIDEGSFDMLEIPSGDPLRDPLQLRNPIRHNQAVMRTTLIPGLLDTVKRNFNFRNTDLRLYELGKVFLRDRGGLLPDEPLRLGMVMTGYRYPMHWEGKQVEVDFFDLKGVIEELFDALSLKGKVHLDDSDLPPYLEEGASARLMAGDRKVGELGYLARGPCEKWDLEISPLIAEMDFEWLIQNGHTRKTFSRLPRFPEVVRDLSFVVPKDIPAAKLVEQIRHVHRDIAWFEDVAIFDVFEQGESIPPGHRSISFRLRYRHPDRNLTDQEVNLQQQKVISFMEKTLGAKLRG